MQHPPAVHRFLIPLLIFIAFSVSMAFQGSRGLYETSEGRYAECAREMLETGNWIEPSLDYAPHWTKPPLAYWAIALGFKWVGRNEWGARLMNAVAFFLTTLMVAWIGASLWDRRAGIIAGLVYATSLFPAAGAFNLTTDTLLTFWEIFSVLSFIRACRSESPTGRSLWILAMYGGLGFGFLTKGPPALIPLIPMGLWHLKTRKPAGLFSLPGFFIFLAAGLSWYLLVSVLHPDLLPYYLHTEIVARIASGNARNPEWYGPIKVYLPVILLGGGAWSVHGFRLMARGKLLVPKILRKVLAEDPYALFLLFWLVPSLVLFILVRSRLPLYILPLHAPFTLLVARGLSLEADRRGNLEKIVWTAVLSAVLIVGLKGASAVYSSENDMKPLYDLYAEKASAGEKVSVFDESKMYGLEFYLDGRLERLTVSGSEPWADASVETTLHDLGDMPPGARRVILSKKRKSESLDHILQQAKIAYQRYESGKWIAYVL